MSEETIVTNALAKHDPAERAAYLDETCGADPWLRAQVEALLKAREAALPTDFGEGASSATFSHSGEESEPPATVGMPAPLPVGPGSWIGPYKLLQQIGEGGMGVVFMAEQEQPVRRRVAIKVVKPEQAVARFEAERQALALMDHPNIAKVLDAGAIDSRVPYFVMELVQGVPITTYCDRYQLSPRERLALFVPVCLAVQHAHQKGIIHRDLKPSNVLVTLSDGKPVPKVIDFGVAKAIDRRLTDATLFTQFGTVIGTLEYMSPEQAEMAGLDIDTRSDVYSLGVLLYQLLTGTTPLALERRKLRRQAYHEVLRRIREEEPPKPSTRLSDSRETLATIAAQRKIEPARLTKLLRGELDWIVMKALEKDRTRRYETASAFAHDVERYLRDEPVEACPPSARYRLGKFARKHRTLLATSAGFAALLVAATTLSTWLAIRARVAEKKAAESAATARAAEKKAAARAADTQAVNDFLRNDLLGEAAPEKNPREMRLTFKEYLDRAAAKLEGRFDKQPAIEASIRQAIGNTYWKLGEDSDAQPHLERALELSRAALGEDHPETHAIMNMLALVYQEQGNHARAETLLKKILDDQRSKKGEKDPDTLTYTSNLAVLYQDWGKLDLAEPLFQALIKTQREKLGPANRETLATENNLAIQERARGKVAAGENRKDEAKAKLAAAAARLETTQAAQLKTLGRDHLDTLESTINLALVYQDQATLEGDSKKLAAAESLFKNALDALGQKLGEKHPVTLKTMNNLASLYLDVQKLDEAERLYKRCLELARGALGNRSEYTLRPMHGLGFTYFMRKRYAEAEPLFREAHDGYLRLQGPKGPMTVELMINMALILQLLEKHAEAEPYFRGLLALRRDQHPDDSYPVAQAKVGLGGNLYLQEKWAEAEPLLREGLAYRQANQPKDWSTFYTRSLLGGCLAGEKKYAEAEALVIEGYEGMKTPESKLPAQVMNRLSEAGERVVRLYESWGKPEKAAEWRAKLAAKP